MTRYEELVMVAYAKVERSFSNYKLKRTPMGMVGLLMGGGGFSVQATPDAEHNYQAVIDAVHALYAKTEDEEVILFYDSGISELVEYSGAVKALKQVCYVPEYEMYLREKRENSFVIDIQSYLDKITKQVKLEHDDLYKENNQIDEWLKETSNFMKTKYGYDFM